MPERVLLDTDVLVDFLRGNEKAVAFVMDHSDQIILSSIVVVELYAGVRGKEEQSRLDDLADLFPVVPVTAEIAKAGGLYMRNYSKSHGIGLADAILAATAQVEQAELKTLNVRHYPMFRSLAPPYTKR